MCTGSGRKKLLVGSCKKYNYLIIAACRKSITGDLNCCVCGNWNLSGPGLKNHQGPLRTFAGRNGTKHGNFEWEQDKIKYIFGRSKQEWANPSCADLYLGGTGARLLSSSDILYGLLSWEA